MGQKDLNTDEKVTLALAMLDYVFAVMAETVPSFHGSMQELMTAYIEAGSLPAASKAKVLTEVLDIYNKAKARKK